jgi:hypothetical protein
VLFCFGFVCVWCLFGFGGVVAGEVGFFAWGYSEKVLGATGKRSYLEPNSNSMQKSIGEGKSSRILSEVKKMFAGLKKEKMYG